MDSQEITEPGDLAVKINRLFRVVRPSGSPEYSTEEVARLITEEGVRKQNGLTISGTYIWQLRKGYKDNPTKKHLEALAYFFKVDPSYFFDEEQGKLIGAELELVAAMRDAGVHSIALRANGLSPRSIDAIRGMIESARQLEGLEANEEPRRRRSDS